MLGLAAMSEEALSGSALTLLLQVIQRAVWVGFQSSPFKSIGGSLRRSRR